MRKIRNVVVLILLVVTPLLMLVGCSKKSLGYTFLDQTFIYDGTEKVIEIEEPISNGYEVEYSNNKATDVGQYYATANIKNEKGKVVETLRATLTINHAENMAFDAFLSDFTVGYLAGDQLSISILLDDPSALGLTHYDAQWYTYTAYTEQDAVEAIAAIKSIQAELKSYPYDELSPSQQIAYQQLDEYLEQRLYEENIADCFYMQLVYIDQFGGYVSDFGSSIQTLALETKQDVEDIINYVVSTKEAFSSYVDFARDKAAKGYGYTDFTIDQMNSYLSDILAEGESYYLLEDLENKIKATTFLTLEEKNSYCLELELAFKNDYLAGVQILHDGLEDQKRHLEEGYWSIYDGGKELYQNQLKGLLGLKELDMESYIEQIDQALSSASKMEQDALYEIILSQHISSNEELAQFLSKNIFYSGTPESMISYLQEFAKTIVPDLDVVPTISIKEMDQATAKVNNAVAYYTKSTLDSQKMEYITLNPLYLSDYNDTLDTLAHEGYPGHLYAYLYLKQLDIPLISKIMTSTAHAEGWATYVQLALYQHLMDTASSRNMKRTAKYLYAQTLSGHLLETRLDVGIHYEGWTIAQIAKYLGDLGYNSEAAEEIYHLLIEMPTSYAAYGYGKYFFYSLHEEAKSILGDHYKEIEFNEMLLSKGWTSLGILQQTYEEYMKKECHRYGIDYHY